MVNRPNKKGNSFLDFVRDQLRGMAGLSYRPMFGGYGVYRGRIFFGIVFRGRLFFKVWSETQLDYISRGMEPFRPSTRQTLKSYYEVPLDVLERSAELLAWAEAAVGPRAVRRMD